MLGLGVLAAAPWSMVGFLLCGLGVGTYGKDRLKPLLDNTIGVYFTKTDPIFKWSGVRKDKAMLHALAPSILLAVVLAVGMGLPEAGILDSCKFANGTAVTCVRPVGGLAGSHEAMTPVLPDFIATIAPRINELFVSAWGGPALVLFVFVVQIFLCPFEFLHAHGLISKEFDPHMVPPKMTGARNAMKDWRWATLAFWIYVTLTRISLYSTTQWVSGLRKGTGPPVNYYISDHVFLFTSIIAQMQTTLFLAHHASRHKEIGFSKHTLLPMMAAWAVLLVVLLCAFVTALYYHTIFATCVGFVTGEVIFGFCAFYWIGKYRTSILTDNPADTSLYTNLLA